MKRRVVVTGAGCCDADRKYGGRSSGPELKKVRLESGPITKFDASEFKVQIAAEVKGFVAKERMDFKAAKRMELFSQYAVACGERGFRRRRAEYGK